MNVPLKAIGQPVSRVDGPDKVQGHARYAAEFDQPDLMHAAMVLSTIPSGTITAIETKAARSAPGVHAVITHENAPRLPYAPMAKRPQVDAQGGDQLKVFQDPTIRFNGQPVAVVVAETLEQAVHAADLVRVSYEHADGHTTFDRARGRAPSRGNEKAGRPADTEIGDADAALKSAAVSIDANYVQAREHHNAIEPHATIAAWDGDHLTLHDKTQWPDNDRDEIAHVFGIKKENIHVVSPFVGGAFGSALRTWPHVTVAALAARVVQRPVRLELTRRQCYTSIGFRPHTEQRVALGAAADGTLTAIVQEAFGQTATYEEYAETTLDPARNTYACPNVRTRYRLIEMNTNSPCPMRSPGVATGMLALETAMDELAVALRMDPLELRLKNYADRDQHKNLPWSSKELRACYRVAAERFGWSERTPEPRSMRRNGHLIGYGMATAVYPSHRAKASAAATLLRDGTALIRTAGSDMGPGTYTSMTQVAAETLGLPVERVRIELGDTDMPYAPVHGGSITMASVGTAVQAACQALLDDLAGVVKASPDPRLAAFKAGTPEWRDGGLAGPGGVISFAELMEGLGFDRITAEGQSAPGNESKTHSSAAFGAVFAEVEVDPDFGTVRVPRIVGAYDIGRVVNPKTARSQCVGGMVQGVGMALLEQAEWDERFGRPMNGNLAEYVVPVCADIRSLDVTFVPGEDTIFNPLGVKGVAELGLSGVSAAIGNAVYHATGRRVREFPILPERLLMG
ncbi:xanthine dehydrogenase family protein molybdopterin-binding subunit [Salinarimonas soli]|uniref:Xanthine dehydrogenase family protein molybdopterin-binding subunit n=1 Tax=Salinarimonas soli TaxID=1638099 RepID=A0A5B2VHX9_9HYPH|nr:xanthine dehydrogenase family protein molybdopterin-binding subunit [Salinarimonas soli]KAA2237797.1 xanthine dehydrogenase family protein molybdopterin-binding subunit [Salinarimonas soli]